MVTTVQPRAGAGQKFTLALTGNMTLIHTDACIWQVYIRRNVNFRLSMYMHCRMSRPVSASCMPRRCRSKRSIRIAQTLFKYARILVRKVRHAGPEFVKRKARSIRLWGARACEHLSSDIKSRLRARGRNFSRIPNPGSLCLSLSICCCCCFFFFVYRRSSPWKWERKGCRTSGRLIFSLKPIIYLGPSTNWAMTNEHAWDKYKLT